VSDKAPRKHTRITGEMIAIIGVGVAVVAAVAGTFVGLASISHSNASDLRAEIQYLREATSQELKEIRVQLNSLENSQITLESRVDSIDRQMGLLRDTQVSSVSPYVSGNQKP